MELRPNSKPLSTNLPIDKFEIGYFADTIPLEFKNQDHDCYEVFLCLSKNVACTVNQVPYLLNEGDILLLSPHDVHSFMLDNWTEGYKRIVFHIGQECLKNLSTSKTDLTTGFLLAKERNNPLLTQPSITNHLGRILKTLLITNERDGYGDDIEKQDIASLLLLNIARYLKGEHTSVDNKNQNEIVKKALNYIDSNLTKNLSLDQLAKSLYIDKYYLAHLFKKTLKVSPHQYIINKRLEQSKSLIKDGMPIREVVRGVGFKDYTHFFRAFKNQYGLTPKQYHALLENEESE